MASRCPVNSVRVAIEKPRVVASKSFPSIVSITHQLAGGSQPHLYPHLFDLAPLAPFRGEGLGMRGFALCFNWDFIRCCDALHCLGSQNKSLNRRLARNSPTPHPPAPSPRNGARGSKAQQIHADSLRYCSGVVRKCR